ncbi:serine/threonine protein kinase, partial [Corynebacterium sp. ACRQL]
LPTNEPRLPQVRIAVLSAGLNWLRGASDGLDGAAGGAGDGRSRGSRKSKGKRGSQVKRQAATAPLFDVQFTERGLRTGLETSLRQLARQAPFARHRYDLVDMANQIRPRTWF